MTDQPAVDQPEETSVLPGGDYVPARALVIVAHADDIEFGISGTVARWTDAGCEVTYCIVTDNGSGTDDPEMTRERLSAIRETEQRAAAEVSSVTDLVFLDYPDGHVVSSLDLRRDLVREIRRAKPDVLITMDPTVMFLPTNDYINHPDHRAVCQTALDAVFPAAGNRMIFPELLAEGLEPHKVTYVYLMFSLEPNTYVDTTETFQRKMTALRKHTSQVSQMEDLEKFVSQWDQAAGEKIGKPYAEAFRVLKIN